MQSISPADLRKLLDDHTVALFDIRSEDEFTAQHIPGAVLVPGGEIDKDLALTLADKEPVFYCTSGTRTEFAAPHIRGAGVENFKMLTGGLNAWKKEGLPTVERKTGAGTLSIIRQVQLTLGVFLIAASIGIFTGIAELVYVTGFIGLGLSFAGLTGTCGLASLLARMPWNRT